MPVIIPQKDYDRWGKAPPERPPRKTATKKLGLPFRRQGAEILAPSGPGRFFFDP